CHRDRYRQRLKQFPSRKFRLDHNSLGSADWSIGILLKEKENDSTLMGKHMLDAAWCLKWIWTHEVTQVTISVLRELSREFDLFYRLDNFFISLVRIRIHQADGSLPFLSP